MGLEKRNNEDEVSDFESDVEVDVPGPIQPIKLTKTGRVKKEIPKDSDEYRKKCEQMKLCNQKRRENAEKRREEKSLQADEVERKKKEAQQHAILLEQTRRKILEETLIAETQKKAKKLVKKSLPSDAVSITTKKDIEALEQKVEKKLVKQRVRVEQLDEVEEPEQRTIERTPPQPKPQPQPQQQVPQINHFVRGKLGAPRPPVSLSMLRF